MVKVAQRLKDLSSLLPAPAACFGAEVPRELCEAVRVPLSCELSDLRCEEDVLRCAEFPVTSCDVRFDVWCGWMDVCSRSDSSRERSEMSSCARSGSPPRKSRGYLVSDNAVSSRLAASVLAVSAERTTIAATARPAGETAAMIRETVSSAGASGCGGAVSRLTRHPLGWAPRVIPYGEIA